MCSGGDLDGDDYLVMWDPDLLPDEWNHTPMDYTAPPPLISDGPVTVDAMTSFFVTHMKNDNLGRIATAHRYWADREDDGVKHDYCLELAALHSMAVDYAKTGVPAEMPRHLKVSKWPHWAEKENSRSYTSRRILGQLYDEVDRVPFEPTWELPFDKRILEAYKLDDYALFDLVKETKRSYDEAIRRLMNQHGIRTEFEVWTTFILEHNHENRDYKTSEELGEAVAGLKRQFQDLCYEGAGTTPKERDWDKLKLWVAAMYTVTAQETAAANEECDSRILVAGEWVQQRYRNTETMPLISFPWLFQRELGVIAKRRDDSLSVSKTAPTLHFAGKQKSKTIAEFQGNGIFLDPLPVLPPSISTEPETMNLKKDATSDADPLPGNDRKDSCTIDRPVAEITSPAEPSLSSAPSNFQEGASSREPGIMSSKKTFDIPAPDIHVDHQVLTESSAFDISDRDFISRGLAEINALPVEASGEYKKSEIEQLTAQGLPQTDSSGVEEMPLVDLNDDADDEGASEGEQVSSQHDTILRFGE
jgi:RNA-dependent RNA polymerase